MASPSSKAVALCKAVKDSDTEGVRKLLEQGADPNEKDEHGNPPLLYASVRSLEIVKLLVDHGAGVNARSKAGITPIKMCMLTAASSIFPAAHNTVLSFLIRNGADLDNIDANGTTALEWAHTLGRQEAAKLIKNALRSRKRRAKLEAERARRRLTDIHNTVAAKQKALNNYRPKTSLIRKNTPA